MHTKWTNEELGIIEAKAELYTPKQIASILKRHGYFRTTIAIATKLWALGYSTSPFLDNYSSAEIARILCVHSTTVSGWLRRGWLKTSRRCSKRYQVPLMKVMLLTQVEPVKQQEPPHTLAPSHEAAQLAMMLGEFAGLDKSLTAQLAVNAATIVNPALKPAADELKIAIAQTNVAEDAFLNPTQIGEVVGMSARAVNHCLLNSGLQYRTDDKKIPYRPTESGKQWGRMVLAVAKSSNVKNYTSGYIFHVGCGNIARHTNYFKSFD
jgi:hypothetical protein